MPGQIANSIVCSTCPRGCKLAPGQVGACRARRNRDGSIVPENYGRVTSLALDPIEKKPLKRFMPGSLVVSVGSYGCNMRCPFCQNFEISQVDADAVPWRDIAPEELLDITLEQRKRDPRVVGIAYTYNEPLISWEYVRDCAALAHERGLVNVLVSNGCASEHVVRKLAPLIDAANIDLKAFDAAFYQRCGGNLATVRRAIELLAATPTCHVEVTTLIIPDENDSPEQMDAEARWLALLDRGSEQDSGGGIPLHITRFFPRWHLTDREPTPVATLQELAAVAKRHLAHVYLGNC